ncbi:MaoC family dehydratase [Ramlibacter sp. AW1]|uniref:MaoC family dehydratase n=1 Tax=Ramlibacter aurantiacus TaxID=2801330 RepID=A0A936ZVS6_9BURK|nr:MaoC family dehydratase [Ramlibacter aurantiacus]MBL0421469.1 MaoC family dehydratase [Ramlibacter aurantiacus]
MVRVEHFAELAPWVGQELGVSGWVRIEQPTIDAFGTLTGDQHWIHLDPARARAEGPFGGTIAHGFLTLSLLTGLLKQCFDVTAAKRWVNYGLDRVRFTTPVKPGDRIRLRLVLASFEMREDGGARLACQCTMEIEGGERPALAATFGMLGYE